MGGEERRGGREKRVKSERIRREKERRMERERDTHTHTERDTQRHIETHRDTQRRATPQCGLLIINKKSENKVGGKQRPTLR